MALDTGPLPVAAVDSIARTDFNNAMTQLNTAFPLKSANLDALQVVEEKIGALAVAEGKIAGGAVTETKIGALAVTEAKLAALAVTEAKIAALAVTEAKIAALAVDNGKIADATIQPGKLAFGTSLITYVPRNICGPAINFSTSTPQTFYPLPIPAFIPATAKGVFLFFEITVVVGGGLNYPNCFKVLGDMAGGIIGRVNLPVQMNDEDGLSLLMPFDPNALGFYWESADNSSAAYSIEVYCYGFIE